MKKKSMHLTDDKFLELFENQRLPIEQFNHHGHLRLTWLYLNRFPLEVAINKVTNGISKYASYHGAPDKFQHTLTEAIVRIMDIRMKNGSEETLEAYLANNMDLVEDIWSVVDVHYTKERLNSEEARTGFVSPDLLPLNGSKAA